MAGQEQCRGGQLVDAVEGGQGLVAVVCEGAADEAGPGLPGQAVVGNQGIPGEQQTALGKQVGAAARRVTGQGDGLRRTGHTFQPLIAREGSDVRYGTGREGSLAGHMQWGSSGRGAAQQVGEHGALRFGVAQSTSWAVAKDIGVLLMDPDVGPGLVERVGQTGVVGVAVGEEDGADVCQGTARIGQVLAQLPEVCRQTSVDENQSVGILDQVEIDDVVAEAVDAWSDVAVGGTGHAFLRRLGGSSHISIQLTVMDLEERCPMAPDAPHRSYDASRRQDAARRNRAAMLAACRELLFAEGYRAATVRAVAERAGVSPETVYKAFGGKTGLVKALWDVTLAGDDEPVAMADRPQLAAVWETRDPRVKLRLYVAFVRGVHERLAPLFALLSQAGGDLAEVLAVSERERLTGVTKFVGHLSDSGVLRSGSDPAHLADVCWALTGPQLFTQLANRGWHADAYETWLADMLAAALLNLS